MTIVELRICLKHIFLKNNNCANKPVRKDNFIFCERLLSRKQSIIWLNSGKQWRKKSYKDLNNGFWLKQLNFGKLVMSYEQNSKVFTVLLFTIL